MRKQTWSQFTAERPATPKPATAADAAALRTLVLARFYEVRDHGHGLQLAPYEDGRWLVDSLTTVLTLRLQSAPSIAPAPMLDEVLAELLA
jgi:hypothetical protein